MLVFTNALCIRHALLNGLVKQLQQREVYFDLLMVTHEAPHHEVAALRLRMSHFRYIY